MSIVTYFILRAYTRTSASHNNIGITLEKFWKNVGVWTRAVEISKEEIPVSKCSVYCFILTHSRLLKGEPLSSAFSTNGTLISASVAPHRGVNEGKE